MCSVGQAHPMAAQICGARQPLASLREAASLRCGPMRRSSSCPQPQYEFSTRYAPVLQPRDFAFGRR